MTTRLSCRDVERLILEGEEWELAREERRLVEDHRYLSSRRASATTARLVRLCCSLRSAASR